MYINPVKHFTDKVIIERKTRVATIELFNKGKASKTNMINLEFRLKLGGGRGLKVFEGPIIWLVFYGSNVLRMIKMFPNHKIGPKFGKGRGEGSAKSASL